MGYRKIILLIIAIHMPIVCAKAQTTGGDYEYKKEFLYGIAKSTNGGFLSGFFLRWGIQTQEKTYQHFSIEIANVKHPKEIKRNNRRRNFTFGKKNYLYVIRGSYGIEKILFRKASQKGVQVNAIGAAGPSIGVLAPYYVKITEANSTILTQNQSVSVPYTEDLLGDQSLITGPGNPFKGLGDANLNIGINLKLALAFEFGAFKRNVTGFEAGFMLEAFANEAEILHKIPNKKVFPSAFITLFYGFRK